MHPMLRTRNTSRLRIAHIQSAIQVPDRAMHAAEPAFMVIQIPRLIIRAVRITLDGHLAPRVSRATRVVHAYGAFRAAVEPLAVIIFPLRL